MRKPQVQLVWFTALTLLFFISACTTTSRDRGVIDDGLTAPVEDVSPEIVDQQPNYTFDDDDSSQRSGSTSAEQFKQTRPPSGTVVALLNQAQRQKQSGNPERAAAVLERALRLDPKNAQLWHELAQIRLEQGRLDMAEDLAIKSNALASDDDSLSQRNHRIIKQVKILRGD